MDKVKGRISETFRLPSGNHLNGEFLTTIFDDHPESIRQFQVHQLKDGSIDISVVPAEESERTDAIFEEVRRHLGEMCNNEVAVSLHKVAEIPRRGGKLQYVISDLK